MKANEAPEKIWINPIQDAPIGGFRMPMFPNEAHLPIDLIKPLYCNFTCVTTEIGEVKIKNYEIIIDE